MRNWVLGLSFLTGLVLLISPKVYADGFGDLRGTFSYQFEEPLPTDAFRTRGTFQALGLLANHSEVLGRAKRGVDL